MTWLNIWSRRCGSPDTRSLKVSKFQFVIVNHDFGKYSVCTAVTWGGMDVVLRHAGVHGQKCPLSWSFVKFPCSTLSFAPEHRSLQQPSADDYRFEGCGLFVIDWLLLHSESTSLHPGIL